MPMPFFPSLQKGLGMKLVTPLPTYPLQQQFLNGSGAMHATKVSKDQDPLLLNKKQDSNSQFHGKQHEQRPFTLYIHYSIPLCIPHSSPVIVHYPAVNNEKLA